MKTIILIVVLFVLSVLAQQAERARPKPCDETVLIQRPELIDPPFYEEISLDSLNKLGAHWKDLRIQ